MIGAVLFDIDGTLVDTNDLHAAAWAEAFNHFGHSIGPQDVRGQIGKGGDNLIPTLLPDISEEEQEKLESFRGDLFQRCYLPRAVPFDGVRALFERLFADGVKIVLASSAKRQELDYHLGLIGASDLVSAATSADDVEASKPCPDIFDAARQKTGLPANQVLVVGDTPWDVKAARRAGIATIAVRCGGFPEEDLRDAGAVAIYDGPADLLARYPEWLRAP